MRLKISRAKTLGDLSDFKPDTKLTGGIPQQAVQSPKHGPGDKR
jgi:hypothetical protein